MHALLHLLGRFLLAGVIVAACVVMMKRGSPPSPPAATRATESPAAPILDGWTLAEVEGRHGAPITRDARTAWAEWPSFRAHFTNGVVDEVQPR